MHIVWTTTIMAADGGQNYGTIKAESRQKETMALLQIVPENIGSSEKLDEIIRLLDPSSISQFWTDVDNYREDGMKYGKERSIAEAIDEVRANNIIQHFEKTDEDPVLIMMTDWFDTYEAWIDDIDLIRGFERQISKMAKIILNREYRNVREHNAKVSLPDAKICKYSRKKFRLMNDNEGAEKTILELCGEGSKRRNIRRQKRTQENPLISSKSYKRDFSAIAQCIIENDPRTLNPPTALVLALKYKDDKLASLLISKTSKPRVRKIFQHEGDDKQDISFMEIIKDPNMKRTVFEVLESTISKEWPYQPQKERTSGENGYAITDDPVRYHFFYQILDGDQQGRPPKRPLCKASTTPGQALIEKTQFAKNPDFDHTSMSCLQALCQSPHKRLVNHPTVRLLARTKWDQYAEKCIWFYASIFVVYLTLLAVSLLLAAMAKNATQYPKSIDKFRGFCEFLTVIGSVAYLCVEVDQLMKEGFCPYIKDCFNWADVLGSFGVLLLIPLRFSETRSQWVVASLVYTLNFLRIYKYFPAWKALGVYVKTLAILFKRDLTVFFCVYIMVLFTFCGATFLSFRASVVYTEHEGFNNTDVSGFGDVFLRGIKSLAQSQEFATKEINYSLFSIIVILSGMFIIMIFLVNILIAQLSQSYETAKEEASGDYDVAKALFVAKLDNSRFRFWNLRLHYYRRGAYENRRDVIKELISRRELLRKEMNSIADY